MGKNCQDDHRRQTTEIPGLRTFTSTLVKPRVSSCGLVPLPLSLPFLSIDDGLFLDRREPLIASLRGMFFMTLTLRFSVLFFQV